MKSYINLNKVKLLVYIKSHKKDMDNKMKLCAFLTSRCSHKCKFCNIRNNLGSYGESSLHEWKEVIRAIKPTFFIFFGGESMLWPEWRELAAYLRSSSIDYTIFTTNRNVAEPITVSIDTPDDERTQFGWRMTVDRTDVVANVQIMKSNCEWAKQCISEFDKDSVPWLVDFHHCGNSVGYLLRAPVCNERLEVAQINDLRAFLVDDRWKYSLERPEVYGKVCDAALTGWKCSPEKSIEYLTVAPDTRFLSCVDLPLDEKLMATDWPDNKEDYIRSRCRVRDLCGGCYWRHEISAELNLYDSRWSTEEMLQR